MAVMAVNKCCASNGSGCVASVERINPDGAKVKVEIPNSSKSFHPPPSDMTMISSAPLHTKTITNTTTILSPFAGPGGISYFAADPAMTAFLQPSMATAVAPPASGYQFIEMDIWEATETEDVAAVQAHLMNGAPPDQRNNSRSTWLHRTAWQSANPYKVMRLLISYNVIVNLMNENGNTVLQNVLMKLDDPRLIKLLLDNSAD
ncbi:hypothetical protein DFQ27_007776 [Actinomortierella ambigua]|uniref:Uncharacterized protein n=1 Tax=Actinomortierella ambigua TaxID=1343610 RepID=A0A9P6PS47_9FUNG|nr:hypothetical protein DFQ27_007776 [Actinomortierella ambigua]